MAPPLRVVVRRGSFVESVHRVHAVAVRDGRVVASVGDTAFPGSLRSAAKPFQALALARARDDLDDADLAIAAASHSAEPAQLDAVRRLLARAPASESDLVCGYDARNGGAGLLHNCSGKHAGMLAACRGRGWPTAGYHRAGHPLQREILADVAAAASVRDAELATAVDGCGVVCFELPLERCAAMFARLTDQPGGERVAAAMRACPELVGGATAVDTRVMRARPGWVAKRGAEAIFCARSPDGVGVALKVEDGGYRAVAVAVAAFFDALGAPVPELAEQLVTNSRGQRVGEIVAADERTRYERVNAK